jgi:chloramphenicol-sensitive protein RarD|tara:strand:+ start:51 stop:377 length:327 start_codon:yes stop_codon:yes gene_type:complete
MALSNPSPSLRNQGLIPATIAFTLWGVLPVYWKLLDDFGPLEIVCHRIVWSIMALLLWQWSRGRLTNLIQALQEPRKARCHLLTGLLLLGNWLIYVWATHNGQILEAS